MLQARAAEPPQVDRQPQESHCNAMTHHCRKDVSEHQLEQVHSRRCGENTYQRNRADQESITRGDPGMTMRDVSHGM